MSLNLHKILVSDDGSKQQTFFFSLEQIQNLKENVRSIEGEEFNHGGNCWNVVCTVKNNYLGVYLKLKSVSSSISVTGKFSLSLQHQHNTQNTKFCSASQTFSSTHPFFGKSKLISMDDFLNASNGYLDSTGKRALLEVKMYENCTRFQIIIDTSTKGRHKTNPNGTYFDTNSFHFANHRWFLRFYLRKLNNKNLPAIYLYLQDGSPHGVSLQLQFILFLSSQATELLHYDFADGAKYDGFGKTLPCAIDNADRVSEMEVAVEIESLCVYKFVPLHVHRSSSLLNPVKNLPVYSNRSSSPFNRSTTSSPRQRTATSRASSPHKISQLSESPNQIFQDHHGNQWRLNFSKETFLPSSFNLSFDKGIYSYPNNHTTVAIIIAHVMSHDTQLPRDLHSNNNHPVTTYFSNFTDDKGHLLSFPLSFDELIKPQNNYLNDNEEVVVRVDFLSVQSTKFPERSGPKFDSFFQLLYNIKHDSDERSQDLSFSRDISISRGSLSLFDDQALSLSSASSGPANVTSPTQENRKNNSFNRSISNTPRNNPTLSPTSGPSSNNNTNNNRMKNVFSPTLDLNNSLHSTNKLLTPNNKAYSRTISANSEANSRTSTPNSSSWTKSDKISSPNSTSLSSSKQKTSIINNTSLPHVNGISHEIMPVLINSLPSDNSSSIQNNNNHFLKSFIHHLSLQHQTNNDNTTKQQTNNNNTTKQQTNNTSKQQITTQQRPLKPPQPPSSPYNDSINEHSLLNGSLSDPDLDTKHLQQVHQIISLVKSKLPFAVSRVCLLGSIGTQTTTPCHHDCDVILVCPDLPTTGKSLWMCAIMQSLADALRGSLDGWKDEKDGLKKEINEGVKSINVFSITPTYVCVQVDVSGGLEVDVMLVGGVDDNGERWKEERMTEGEGQLWCSGEEVLKRSQFYAGMDEQVKSYIKVLKRWMASVEWRKAEYQPDRHLISLLTYKAYLLSQNKSIFKVLQKVNLLVQEAELRISWDHIKDSTEFDPPTPLIIDPSNPTINVASSLKYWGQFRTEMATWLAKMKLNLY